jgi:segregation and condensation protein B
LSGRGERLRLLEALIFAAGEPVGEEILSSRLEEADDLSDLLRELSATYAGRGLNLVRLGGGWTFRTALDLADRLSIERRVKKKLSRAAVETLAVIAYHQPVTRGEIEEMRGVGLGKGTLDLLMETGWVQPKGRRASPGRPLLWVTTPAFLVHFGLDSLDDLPRLDELSAAGLVDVAKPHARASEREKTPPGASPARGGNGA